MKKILYFIGILALNVLIFSQTKQLSDHSKLKLDCKNCHVCNVPTKDDPCLVACPREKIATVYQKPEETPELIVINQLTDRYGPVYFSHRIHAQMSIMSGGCENCHHFNTSGPILQCSTCHQTSRKREDVRIPDLRGAYHRQCMDCHREWSHETGCNSCHDLKKNIKDEKTAAPQKKYAGKVHPTVMEPVHITYQTNSEKGKLVTFYHDDHTKKFGLDCISCHKQENCTKCHDVNKKSESNNKIVRTKKTFEEQHKNCISCHNKSESCVNCHSEKVLEPFDHARRTGWALNKYHLKLSCSKCHGTNIPYSKLDNNCTSCHSGWSNENFKHNVTGLQLDETHAEMNCEDCHLDKNFAVKPSCDGCHEGYSFPKYKPGRLTEKK